MHLMKCVDKTVEILNESRINMRGIIYCYTSPKGKPYVGQTLDEIRRKHQHFRDAFKSERDKDKPFYRAIRKYGWNSFEYEILWEKELEDIVRLRKILNKMEEFYISVLDARENGYNCTNGGNSIYMNSEVGHTLTEEHKQKLKDSVSQKVWQYDLEGNFITAFDSAADASKATGCNSSTIISCCRGKTHTSKGFQWRYAGDTCCKYVPRKHKVIKRFGKDNPKSKIVIRIDENGKEAKRWDSLMDVARELCCNSGTICRAIKEGWKCKGFHYKYLEQ